MPLPDEVIVYPAHGAGSACGKNMSKETWSTLGEQKRSNYALRADMTKEEFIAEVTAGLAPPPQYFAKNARMNKMGYESFDTVMKRGAHALTPKEFEDAANATDAVILDVRDKEEFVKGFIPNSTFIGLDGTFAPWVGALIPDLQQAILIVAPEGREEETIKRLSRVGYDNSIGYLKGGFKTWKADGREVDQIKSVTPKEFAKIFTQDDPIKVLDVRKPAEWEGEHIEDSDNFPLDFISANMHTIDKDEEYYLHCRSGYRSTVAASILKARGFEKVIDVVGTLDDMMAAGIPTTDYVCPTKKAIIDD